jgi:hypothetical protein
MPIAAEHAACQLSAESGKSIPKKESIDFQPLAAFLLDFFRIAEKMLQRR